MQPQTGHSETIIHRISGEQLLDIFRKEGFYAELSRDKAGDPKVVFKVEGYRCIALFYDVQDGAASSLQFSTGFQSKKPLEKVNLWNRTRRFLKAYLDDEGDLLLELDVDLDGGVTEAHVAEQIKLFRQTLLSCLRFMHDDSHDPGKLQTAPADNPQ